MPNLNRRQGSWKKIEFKLVNITSIELDEQNELLKLEKSKNQLVKVGASFDLEETLDRFLDTYQALDEHVRSKGGEGILNFFHSHYEVKD